ncbi:aldo/keto reductase [Bacteroides gallinaceum]|uniref:Aldo/keto reductase n=2 Tax=Bacteroidaceae TaxID=815 RepID=A0ABT7VF02_9BACE|nr:aldo/keto reductase [Bacteroides gallinaceum]MBU3856267.1 aldo/keto reductase [Candidatus Phocaeicola excrementipullorum]MDM8324886.1 aldo/keto reductase [Bacteroides gallinaceum]
MEKIKLNNGVEMPILGLGVYQMSKKECENSVCEAIRLGYRSIDTASAYCNEEAVGSGIKKSGIDRKELFITTKLWIKDAGYESARAAVEKSLRKLQTDYLDLYLIHQPYGDVFGAWRAMEEMYKEGKIRAIGLSNFFPDRFMDLTLHNTLIPAVCQMEVHPYCQQIATQQFLGGYDTCLEAWSPFAQNPAIFQDETLKAIAAKTGKSVAQVILRWLIQRGIIVLTKSTHTERLRENMDVFDFELDADDMATIAKLDTGRSTIFDHRDPACVKMICEAQFDY